MISFFLLFSILVTENATFQLFRDPFSLQIAWIITVK